MLDKQESVAPQLDTDLFKATTCSLVSKNNTLFSFKGVVLTFLGTMLIHM